MLEVILYSVAVIVLLAASYWDLKKNEVPDWLSYAFLFAVLGIRLLASIFEHDIHIFLTGLFGFLVFFAISALFYYGAQWGGGDVKIAMGTGALLGLSLNAILFVVLLLFSGAVYGILWSVYLAYKHKHEFAREFRILFKEFRLVVYAITALFIISLASLFIIADIVLATLLVAIGFVMFIGILSFLFVKAVEDGCLHRSVRATELTEGDWLMKSIMINGTLVVEKGGTGITKEQIQKLKHYKKLIQIKLGIPFIPAFLLAFIAFMFLKGIFISLL